MSPSPLTSVLQITNPKTWAPFFVPTTPWLDHLLGTLSRHMSNYPRGQISFLFTSNRVIRRYNAQYRNIDKPTNVLAFPASSPIPSWTFLGDIVLGFEQILSESHDLQIDFAHHLTHMVIHGALHLMGFDHQTEAETRIMRAHETKTLHQLGLSSPFSTP